MTNQLALFEDVAICHRCGEPVTEYLDKQILSSARIEPPPGRKCWCGTGTTYGECLACNHAIAAQQLRDYAMRNARSADQRAAALRLFADLRLLTTTEGINE